MNYRECLPSKQLQNIVLNYWIFEVKEQEEIAFPIQHEIIPDSHVSIVLIRQPYFQGQRLLGPHTQKYEQAVYPNSLFFGIKLLPWLSFSPSLFSKKEIVNLTLDAPPLISKYLDDLSSEDLRYESFTPTVIERKLEHLFDNFDIAQNDVIKFICLELSKKSSIASIVEKLPFSVRVIQKKFKEIVGISMRQYASNLRQRELWTDLVKSGESKLDLIFKHNYYDQAHFIHDFTKKMQRAPSDYESYLKKIEISLL